MAVKRMFTKTRPANGEPMLYKLKKINPDRRDMAKTETAPSEITFRVYKDEDGVLCASSLDGEVYTFGKTMSALWKNCDIAYR